jgi:hypothetical protein
MLKMIAAALLLSACAGTQNSTIEGSGVKAPGPGGYEWMCFTQPDSPLCGRDPK